MNPETMQRFDRARELAGIPFVITSAARSRDHELRMKRTGNSSHVFTATKKAHALDIRFGDSKRNCFLIVNALIRAGFTRIGINFVKGYIHADDDPAKDQQIIWSYP